jgi:hypothetical protein
LTVAGEQAESGEEKRLVRRSGSPDFGPFSEDRARIERITSRLDVADDLTERADLASELVRAVSRYEDTFERVLLPRRQESDPDLFQQLDDERTALRDTMDQIHQRTMGIDPRNVHASDGQGFEDALSAVVAQTRALLVVEDREIDALWDSLGADQRQALVDEVIHAFKSASERPHPPRTSVGRFLSNAHVKMDHTLEDVSTPRHPGADTVQG